MVQINFARKEVNCKIVYYGCGLSGKTTNLEVVHEKAPADRKGELTSIATEGDRTLFFDFMPLELGKVGGMNTKFQLYTVPGQVYYNATRKLVLQGADGVIFVVDSQAEKLQENKDSWQNLVENLREQGLDIKKIPLVIQYNKRDLPSAMPIEVLEREINVLGSPYFEAIAVTGEGVFPTLKKLSSMVLDSLNKQYGVGGKVGAAAPPPREAVGARSSEIKKVESGELAKPREPPKEREAADGREKQKVAKISAIEVATAKAAKAAVGGGGAPPVEKARPREQRDETPPRRPPEEPRRERVERRPEPPPRRGREEPEQAGTGARKGQPPAREEEERPRPRPKAPAPPPKEKGPSGGGGMRLYLLVGLLAVAFAYLVASGRLVKLFDVFFGK
jgi:signal recognition particle receptor subunit beta